MKVATSTLNKWIAALRSEEYAQTIGALQRGDKFCCLGVACKLFIPKELLNSTPTGQLRGGIPGSSQKHAPKWLKEISADFGTRYAGSFHSSLVTLNDNHYTFNEIADLLELVYIHKALD